MTGAPGPDPRAKGLKHLGELNNVLSKLGEGGGGGVTIYPDVLLLTLH